MRGQTCANGRQGGKRGQTCADEAPDSNRISSRTPDRRARPYLSVEATTYTT